MDDWPDCAVDGCPNKCCLALDSIYCFPHTPGNKHVKHMKIDARHPENDPGDFAEDRDPELVGFDG